MVRPCEESNGAHFRRRCRWLFARRAVERIPELPAKHYPEQFDPVCFGVVETVKSNGWQPPGRSVVVNLKFLGLCWLKRYPPGWTPMRNGFCGLLQGFTGVWYIRGCRDGLVQGSVISVSAQTVKMSCLAVKMS